MSNRDEWHWSPCPPGTAASEPVAIPSSEDALRSTGPVRVVGLGAICDLRRASEDGRSLSFSVSFSVSEFASLDDGRRVILHNDRGFTIGWGASMSSNSDFSKYETPESITRDVLNVVLPDDDDSGEDHPWWWLADLAQARGINVTAEDLRGLPYQVVLTDSVTRLLSTA